MTAESHVPQTTAFLLTEHAGQWLDAILLRRSRRRFDGRQVDDERLHALESLCQRFHPHPDARAVLIASPRTDVFHGIIGGYGKVTGAPHVLAIIADERSSASHLHAGYVGEAVILAATALGLDSCWVGGFFSPRKIRRLVELTPESRERVIAVSPIGFAEGAEPQGSEVLMRRLSHAHDRKPLTVIAPGAEAWPAWARAAVEAARRAPSAMNRQPWRFRLEAGALILSSDSAAETPRVTKALDCGIAMLHAELGATGTGACGHWTGLRQGLDLARFEVEQ